MGKPFLTQQEKIYLRNLKNRGQKLPKDAQRNIFGKKYNPSFIYK